MAGGLIHASLRLAQPTDFAVRDGDIAYLNVRGTAFMMEKRHAIRSPTLKRLLETYKLPQNDIYYPVDRDYKAFTTAASYLRDLDNWTGFRDHANLAAIWREAIWLEVDELADKVREILQKNTPPVLLRVRHREEEYSVECTAPSGSNAATYVTSHSEGVERDLLIPFLAEFMAAAESDGYEFIRTIELPGEDEGKCYMFKYSVALHSTNLLKARMYTPSTVASPLVTASTVAGGRVVGGVVKADPGSSPQRNSSPVQQTSSGNVSPVSERSEKDLSIGAKEFIPKGKGRKK